MNYAAIHDAIISKARNQSRSKMHGFYELHHIRMKSLGGDDSEENTILLTPREHFLIHYLLWKIHNLDDRYRHPILLFRHKGAANSRLYEAARIAHTIKMKTDNPSLHLSEESRKNKSEKLKKYIKTEQHKANISRANKGRATRTGAVLSDATRSKIAQSVKRWNKENGVSAETRSKISKANIGRKHSATSIEKMTKSAEARRKYKCPHCSKDFDGGNLARHMTAQGFDAKQIEEVKSY